jgi:hypothetical protein
MGDSPLERRRSPRIPCELAVRVQHQDGWIDATAANLSQGGMLLKMQARVPMHAQLSVHCVLAGAVRMHITGEVVHLDDRTGEVGVAFARLNPVAAEQLRRDLERRVLQM